MSLSPLSPKKSTPVEYEPPIKPSEIPPGKRFFIRYLIACLPSIFQYIAREQQLQALREWAKKRGGSHEQ